MKEIILSSSILSADFSRLKEQINEAENAGVDWIHIDVMDGRFVPNITMGPFIVETCRKITRLPLDVHLMIDNPEYHIEPFANAGADFLTVHIENTPNIYRILQHIRTLGSHPGIAINPGTPARNIEAILHLIDMVLVMTVNPGFSGQVFMPEMISKISAVKDMLQISQPSAYLQVDGGITPVTLPATVQAGANTIVAATAIFKHPDGIAAGIKSLREAVG